MVTIKKWMSQNLLNDGLAILLVFSFVFLSCELGQKSPAAERRDLLCVYNIDCKIWPNLSICNSLFFFFLPCALVYCSL